MVPPTNNNEVVFLPAPIAESYFKFWNRVEDHINAYPGFVDERKELHYSYCRAHIVPDWTKREETIARGVLTVSGICGCLNSMMVLLDEKCVDYYCYAHSMWTAHMVIWDLPAEVLLEIIYPGLVDVLHDYQKRCASWIRLGFNDAYETDPGLFVTRVTITMGSMDESLVEQEPDIIWFKEEE